MSRDYRRGHHAGIDHVAFVVLLVHVHVRTAHAAGSRIRLADLRPELPRAFVQIVERSTDPDPQGRFGTAAEFEGALTAALESTTSVIQVPSGGRTAVSRLRRYGKTAAHRRRPLDRDQALTDIASARLLLANLDRIDDPAIHAATVIVSRIGHGREDRGAAGQGLDPVGLMIPAIARKGWTDQIAIRRRSETAGYRVAYAGSCVVIAAGTYWFVQRVFFPGGV